jgi:hypothetical protein
MSDVSKTVTEITEQAKKIGMVKLPRDEYEELVRKAARPIVRNVTTILKTDAQNASDNKVFGIMLVVIGGSVGTAMVASGAFLYKHAVQSVTK